jgi:multiple sugar transport system permease protein
VILGAKRNAVAWSFLIGAVVCFAVFSWYPMIREIVMSFQFRHLNLATGVPETSWAGLQNYRRIFDDPQFWTSVRNTVEFTFLALIFGYALPFFTAILLNEMRHAKGYLRCLVYLPVMLPPISALTLFLYFYDPTYGLFNHILHALDLPTSQWTLSSGTGLISMAMISVVIASTWMNMGGATLIYLAALQNIPGELYEAAELDGAGLFKKIRHITIPQTRLILSMLLLLQIVATMQMFIEAFILTGGQGVNNNTETLVYLIYQYAFAMSGSANFNSASALGVMLLCVLAAFSGGYLWLNRERRLHGFPCHEPAWRAGPPTADQRGHPFAHLTGAAESRTQPDHLPGRPHRGGRGLHAALHRAAVLPVHRRDEIHPGGDLQPSDVLPAPRPPGQLREGVGPAEHGLAIPQHLHLRGRRAGLPADLRRVRGLRDLPAAPGARQPHLRHDAGHADDPGDRVARPAVPDGGGPANHPHQHHRYAGGDLAAHRRERVQHLLAEAVLRLDTERAA